MTRLGIITNDVRKGLGVLASSYGWSMTGKWFWLPSGKHTKNYGKSPFLMGKSTISMVMFNSYVKLPEGIQWVFQCYSVKGLLIATQWLVHGYGMGI